MKIRCTSRLFVYTQSTTTVPISLTPSCGRPTRAHQSDCKITLKLAQVDEDDEDNARLYKRTSEFKDEPVG